MASISQLKGVISKPSMPVCLDDMNPFSTFSEKEPDLAAKVGSKVVLRCYNGSVSAPSATRPAEHYWQLIGTAGEVVRVDAVAQSVERGRVLVRFHTDVCALGLACHNETPNALWIRTSDLQWIDETDF
ncbi:hypothetical protein AGMMS49960_03280 [Betaproteobacteria bacterium]|nr:hypothetical protein AGMMS49543_01620 [Betaproteobacteria bacterium]GHT89876.1 hypothetical protein AGMMS49545_01460 [Betaproteobacteria bacterium]GHT99017.1 hypothetical protein AGMMS49960_03280 [Betaproteobacteria bacterium]GHU19549.1 hypothetical protein AGMMS50243_11820 [Betaproteobacteria bacterium]GHU48519.1 hypothetical protein AGMMS50289_25200 [Betaproteobacteria bacterium]